MVRGSSRPRWWGYCHSDNGKRTAKGGGKSNNPHSGSMACANADTPATQLTQTAAEEAVLCLINEQRVANGVPALTLNLKLRAAARLHARTPGQSSGGPVEEATFTRIP
jgi:uncharacterized protein YkwD